MTRAFILLLAGALKTRPAVALLDTYTVRLFTAGPTPITVLSNQDQFTEPTFGGYAPVTATLGSPSNLPSQQGIGYINHADFTCTSSATSDTIQGYYVCDGGGDLVGAELFEAPFVISQVGDFISLDTVIPVGWQVPNQIP